MSDPDTHPTYVGPSESGSNKPGSVVGDKIKGVARVIHGIGEEIRGSAMSLVDNTLSNQASGAEKNAEITNQGRLQIERGMADLRGRKRTSSAPAPASGGVGGVDKSVGGSSSVLGANENPDIDDANRTSTSKTTL